MQLDLFTGLELIEYDEVEVRAEPERLLRETVGVPDTIWPTDNVLGIPVLNPHKQAHAIDLPFIAWGSKARRDKMHGTYHFYVDDYRFTALWKRPEMVLKSGCINVVEANFSCLEQMPPAVAIYRTYQKRWLARYWQQGGIFVFVDLNVNPQYYKLNLLGVPKGWRSYCTRGYSHRLDWTLEEYTVACNHAGTEDILFIVYGGGKEVKQMCMEHPEWLWIPEQMDVKGKEIANG